MNVKKLDLTEKEQAHVRAALTFLRVRTGGWKALAKIMGYSMRSLVDIAVGGRQPVTASLVFRVARFTNTSIDDVLAGKFPPPGVCPHCGNGTPEHLEGGA